MKTRTKTIYISKLVVAKTFVCKSGFLYAKGDTLYRSGTVLQEERSKSTFFLLHKQDFNDVDGNGYGNIVPMSHLKTLHFREVTTVETTQDKSFSD